MANPVIRAEHLCKTYQMGEVEVPALKDATFVIQDGEFAVILGHSGSGKSTLLNIVGGMDLATSGQLWVKEQEITAMNQRQLTHYRRDRIGFVFQFYNIMSDLTARENVELATEISKNPLDVLQMLDAVGLSDRADHFPSQMSGGEQQRVAIARAIAKNPDLLLCDEPTGALDAATGVAIIALLRKMNRELGKTVLIITHNAEIALAADHVIRMHSGEISEDYYHAEPLEPEQISW